MLMAFLELNSWVSVLDSQCEGSSVPFNGERQNQIWQYRGSWWRPPDLYAARTALQSVMFTMLFNCLTSTEMACYVLMCR